MYGAPALFEVKWGLFFFSIQRVLDNNTTTNITGETQLFAARSATGRALCSASAPQCAVLCSGPYTEPPTASCEHEIHITL